MRSENWDKLTALIVLIVRSNKGLTNSRSIRLPRATGVNDWGEMILNLFKLSYRNRRMRIPRSFL